MVQKFNPSFLTLKCQVSYEEQHGCFERDDYWLLDEGSTLVLLSRKWPLTVLLGFKCGEIGRVHIVIQTWLKIPGTAC